jgi:hypothetical protein
VKHAQIGVAVLAAIACTYLIGTTLSSLQEIWTAERQLRQGKTDAAALSREAANQRRLVAKQKDLGNGGVDAFAVKLSSWTKQRNIRIESIVPEGAPTVTQIKQDGSDLGIWNANRVRIKGRGDFWKVMDLLNLLGKPLFPAQLSSFRLEAEDRGIGGIVAFDLVITVYERKGDNS